MKNYFLFFFLIALLSCSRHSKSEFGSAVMNKHFSVTERQQLAGIVSHTDSLVLSGNKFTDLDLAWHYYLDSIYISARNGKMAVLALEQNSKYEYLFSLDTALFNKIWIKSASAEIVKTKDTVLYRPANFFRIDINYKGEYYKMICDLGKEIDYFKELKLGINIAGGMSPTTIAGFLNSSKEMDFYDPDNRLWAAVFLLTLEESVDQKVYRYLKN